MSWGATAAITAIVSAVAGAAVTVIGNEQASDAADAAAAANKQRADAEARNLELESAEAIRRQRIRDRREQARLRAKLATSGTLTTSGTPLAILSENASNMELNIQDAARATTLQAASLRDSGTMGLWEAGQTRAANNLSSVGSAISAVGSAAGGYSAAKYNGAFTRTKA